MPKSFGYHIWSMGRSTGGERMKMREVRCAECKKVIAMINNFNGIGDIVCLACDSYWRELGGEKI